MSSKFSRRSTRVQHKPHVCRVPPPPDFQGPPPPPYGAYVSADLFWDDGPINCNFATDVHWNAITPTHWQDTGLNSKAFAWTYDLHYHQAGGVFTLHVETEDETHGPIQFDGTSNAWPGTLDWDSNDLPLTGPVNFLLNTNVVHVLGS